VRRVLLDTSAYIDLQRARNHRREAWAINSLRQATAYSRQFGKPFLSTMAVMEIARGLEREQNAVKLRDFFEYVAPNFEIVGFDFHAACLAGKIYAELQNSRNIIGVYDVGIAAIAIQEDMTLVTSNDKHFQRITALGYPLKLENWRNP
jgi:tRNA(fMet)-specific endonuclease VapC